MNIDLGRSVTYPFEDRDWLKKIGILALIGLVPGLNLIVLSGYSLTVARNILRGNQYPLPNWAEWSDIAVRGLLSIVATFIYYLPPILFGCCLWGIANFSGRNGGGLITALQCCGGMFAFVYALVATTLLNAGHMRFTMTDQFHSYMEFGARIQDVRSAPQIFTSLLVIQLILSLLVAVLSGILVITCVGPVIVATFAFLANGFILGTAATAFANRQPGR